MSEKVIIDIDGTDTFDIVRSKYYAVPREKQPLIEFHCSKRWFKSIFGKKWEGPPMILGMTAIYSDDEEQK